ncbi:hypothetical protein G7Z17_g1368 [Cylindrodendrum hubeiense]|uniref:Methyltransferase domain-containing protein n=1 Tax=Cylindrodendrum hubeiense TaxID=595255 RepID=A0A9P5HIM9_9HYPO|nr:hypothetical protein G7Z17_g1368 [Cylindrodendrum hubeiense]
MTNKLESATYTHGHHASVIRAHSWRTAANSAGYLLPYLKSDMKILDIGCGAGTITVDLAKYVPQGHITGLDQAESILDQARALAKDTGVTNVDFVQGDANALEFPGNTFDVVVCHQVLQHVGEPTGILKEMRRVAKVGGFVAARESDYGSWVWYPAAEGLDNWRALYLNVARSNRGEPNAGRMIHAWARDAGFPKADIQCTSSSWCLSTKEAVADWSKGWAERTESADSSFAKSAVGGQFATAAEIAQVAVAWREWGQHEDAWISVPHGEIVCVKRD